MTTIIYFFCMFYLCTIYSLYYTFKFIYFFKIFFYHVSLLPTLLCPHDIEFGSFFQILKIFYKHLQMERKEF